MKVKIFILAVLFGLFAPFGFVQAALPIYISAVQTTGGVGKTTEDVVELFNPNSEAVDLSAYTLVKRTELGATDTVLKSWSQPSYLQGFTHYLWANSGFVALPIAPDATSSGSIADNNGVALRYGEVNTGQLVDSVAWGLSANGFSIVGGNIPAGSMLQRDNLFSAGSSFSVVSTAYRNSTIQTLPNGTEPDETEEGESESNGELEVVIPPTEPPVTFPVVVAPEVYAELEITEIMPNPTGTDTGQEQVELYNPTEQEVSIEGWYLADGTSVLPPSNALVLSGSIGAGEYKTITVPAGKFSLLNSGGETVQLFSPNKEVVFSVAYEGAAGEGQSYQNIGGSWVWQLASMGKKNVLAEEELEAENEDKIKDSVQYGGVEIHEFYSGLDFFSSTQAQVELKNVSNGAIDLSDWMIEVATTSLKKPTEEAEVLPDNLELQASGLVTFDFSKLSGSEFEIDGKYWVMLYSPDGKLQDSINIKSLVGGLSWGKFGSFAWQWGVWSPGITNIPAGKPDLKFNEILPAYKDSESDSFIELKNVGTEPVNVGNLKLGIGSKHIWLAPQILLSGEFLIVTAEDLPALLTPVGKKISLSNANDELVDVVSYLKAKTDESYMQDSAGKWVWTAEPTVGTENVYKKPAVAASLKKATATTSKKPDKISAVKPANNIVSNSTTAIPEEQNPNSSNSKSSRSVWMFGVVAVLLSIAVVAVWFFSKGPELSQ